MHHIILLINTSIIGTFDEAGYKKKTLAGISLRNAKGNYILFFSSIQDRDKALNIISLTSKAIAISDIYRLDKLIGKGKYGDVYEATSIAHNKKYALKKISTQQLTQRELYFVLREIEILKFVNHRNIIKLSDHLTNKTDVYIITELMKSNLEKLVHSNYMRSTSFMESQVKFIITSVLLAVRYLHGIGIVHRDIKPANVLINLINMKVKLADFGLSEIISPTQSFCDFCGTLEFTAPEIVLERPSTHKVDMWSVGVLTYYLLSNGELPYKYDSVLEYKRYA